MTNLQFRVLYRQFLFRVVDLEVLSSHALGDSSKLLGQFAALLIFPGALFGLSVLGVGDGRRPREELLVGAWGMEHLLIATTMLVVGLFAVLSWDSVFPDKRDVLVLAPLPVRAGTLFLAKAAALATALSATVAALNGLVSLAWPLALSPPTSGILDLFLTPAVYRTFAAYWITVIFAGALIFGAVLCLQGLAAQLLPRRHFLRVSALLQIASFGLLISVYFLQPSLTTPRALIAAENQRLLSRLPSYWFLGLFQELNGSMHPGVAPLAHRAWIGLGVIGCGTAAAYLLAYLRTLRRIVEEPDIRPGSRGGGWLPRFGTSFDTAVVQFSIRTLLRSRQHRLILAFYMGVGFAITILFLKTPAARQQLSGAAGDAWHVASGALLASSIVMLSAWIVGIRVVFSMPLDPRANWMFRVTPLPGASACVAARRRALLVLGLAPVWAGSAALFLCIWPWKPAAYHVAMLGLLGAIIVEACLRGAKKIPFTCSWLPGRSNFHITFWLCAGLLMTLVSKGVQFEQSALRDTRRGIAMLLVLGTTALLARWLTAAQARSGNGGIQFEDDVPPVILDLGLHRDGALTIEPPSSRSPLP